MGDLRFRTRPMPPSARAQPRTYYRRAGSAFWGWHPVSTRPKRGPSIKEKKMSDAENTLVLTLDSGDVTINLRPDLAPGHVERITELTRECFRSDVIRVGKECVRKCRV